MWLQMARCTVAVENLAPQRYHGMGYVFHLTACYPRETRYGR
jgi:hypothetical protein